MSYINFNNAGSSYLTERTQKIVKDFFDYENIVGGYNAENLFKDLEIDTSTKKDDNTSAIPTNPFEIVEMIRRSNSLNDATKPSDAIDDALKSFNSLEEKEEI